MVSKLCDYVMFEADSHLKLLPKSILNIYKVFEHIDWASSKALHSFTHPTWLRFWGSVSLMVMESK
jgi:hypothetical protein